ncbi:MAG: GNAT family N-acetyltransferase [Acidimicrobiia bacterium]|nr:GNAT family N-acetyltransferase [Acidimicrobiia bacterium]MDH3396546.1 GNAT family N-acetyltransferase [Acidimicrobiia bacterium]MDH5616126.1 GNAT family N-acetyltransferase [Acidimicrobiia bacterium]
MSYLIRPIVPDELRAFAQVWERAFNFDEKDEELEALKKTFEFDRSIAALDGEQFVGTGGAFSFALTTPGGSVSTGGLTAIAVLPTYRRQGILTDIMRYHFDEVRSREEPLSVLRASESTIYGRYGYGVATIDAGFEIDRRHTNFAAKLPTPGQVRLIDKDEARLTMPAIYERLIPLWPGFLSRSGAEWDLYLLDMEHWRDGMTSNRFVIYEEKGEAIGYLRYRAREKWEQGHAVGELLAAELMAVTPAAESALWDYAFSVDLIQTIKTQSRPAEELLSELLADPRRMKIKRGDGLWARLLDIPASLAGRRYASEGQLVFEVVDSFLPDVGGVFELEGGPDGAACRRSTATPELKLDVAGLSSRYLGDGSFRLLHEAGRLTGEVEAVRRADQMFGWDRLPWCPNYF